MAHSLHRDADAILSRLKKEGITALYHFTSVENLPHICRAQALYSKADLQTRGLLPLVDTGGNDLSFNLDQRNDNWDKVSLNLTPYTPMAYHRKRDQHLCYFVIAPKVATLSGVIFTDTNAASNAHRRGEGLEGLDNINFEVIRSISRIDRETWKKYIQAEVLVPKAVPFEYISEVGFVSQASMEHSKRLCRSLQYPTFSVTPRLFTDSQRASQETIGFPYVRNFILSSTKVDKNMLYLSHNQKNIFSKSFNNCIMVVALVKATAGAQAKIVFCRSAPAREAKYVVGEVEFETSTEYRYECEILLDELLVGVYSIEYYLNDLCWASGDFEIIQ
ncbi:MAG TPA: DUF4433 domain-containing protein [Ktedonosporobacter sp.]|jgi:hypothetical protein|nr:DUF4433 domain-containing protein [Ktedonosporobacter sp.]